MDVLNKKIFACAVGMTLFSGNASAGGIDLTGMPITPLFEVGTFVEGTFTKATLDFSGKDATT